MTVSFGFIRTQLLIVFVALAAIHTRAFVDGQHSMNRHNELVEAGVVIDSEDEEFEQLTAYITYRSQREAMFRYGMEWANR